MTTVMLLSLMLALPRARAEAMPAQLDTLRAAARESAAGDALIPDWNEDELVIAGSLFQKTHRTNKAAAAFKEKYDARGFYPVSMKEAYMTAFL